MARIIGIDLGTTNSLCAVFGDGQPQLIPNALGSYLTPSVVGVVDGSKDGELLVGQAARDLRVTAPERTAALFKRHMGTSRTISLGRRTFTAPELSGLVLRALREDAEAYLGERVRDAVISVPAYFNDPQRKATLRAGKLAGLKVHRIINEPTAAALVHGLHDPESERRVLVLDLGGGTFDVTLMEIFEGSLEIISTAGESFLGGEDFTDAIATWTLDRHGLQPEALALSDPERMARLRTEAELAKCALSDGPSARVRLPEQGGTQTDDGGVELTREEFETICAPLIERIEAPVMKALRDGRTKPHEVEEVVLVGGATRMPLVRQLATRLFPEVPQRDGFDPDHVVALGAAIQAALIEEDEGVADLVMTDVCPFTLGIETSKTLGKRHIAGFYLPVIHRNTTIPVSREECVCTIHPMQTKMTVRVYQGEARRVEGNTYLGEIHIDDIPATADKQDIYVRFTYDLNGVLEVETIVQATGKKQRAVLTNLAEELDDAEVEEALERMQSLKHYPREKQENQALLQHAERVVGEVSIYVRDQFSHLVDVYHHALLGNDRFAFEQVRQELLVRLSELQFPFEPK